MKRLLESDLHRSEENSKLVSGLYPHLEIPSGYSYIFALEWDARFLANSLGVVVSCGSNIFSHAEKL